MLLELLEDEAVVDAPDQVSSGWDKEEIPVRIGVYRRLERFRPVDVSDWEAVKCRDSFLCEVVEVSFRLFLLFLVVLLLPGLVLDVVNVLGHLILI